MQLKSSQHLHTFPRVSRQIRLTESVLNRNISYINTQTLNSNPRTISEMLEKHKIMVRKKREKARLAAQQ